MTPKKPQEEVRTGATHEDMNSMVALGEQMRLGAGELRKVAGVPDLSLSVQPLGQYLVTGGETDCLGKASSQL